jgi:hypothetical protein
MARAPYVMRARRGEMSGRFASWAARTWLRACSARPVWEGRFDEVEEGAGGLVGVALEGAGWCDAYGVEVGGFVVAFGEGGGGADGVGDLGEEADAAGAGPGVDHGLQFPRPVQLAPQSGQ